MFLRIRRYIPLTHTQIANASIFLFLISALILKNFLLSDKEFLIGEEYWFYNHYQLSEIWAFFVNATWPTYTNYYRPSLQALYALEGWFTADPFYYWLTSNFLYVSCACVGFWFIRHFLGFSASLLALILFLVTPSHAAQIEYITHRGDTLYLIFILSAAALASSQLRSFSFFSVLLFLSLLAILTRESGITIAAFAFAFVLIGDGLDYRRLTASIAVFFITIVCRLVFLPLIAELTEPTSSTDFSIYRALTAAPRGFLKTIVQPEVFTMLSWGWIYYIFLLNFYMFLILFFLKFMNIFVFFALNSTLAIFYFFSLGMFFVYSAIAVLSALLALSAAFRYLSNGGLSGNKQEKAVTAILMGFSLMTISFLPHVGGLPDRITFPGSLGLAIVIATLVMAALSDSKIWTRGFLTFGLLIYIGALSFGQYWHFSIFSPNSDSSIHHTLVWRPQGEVFQGRRFSEESENLYWQSLVKSVGVDKDCRLKIDSDNYIDRAYWYRKPSSTSIRYLGVSTGVPEDEFDEYNFNYIVPPGLCKYDHKFR